MCAIQSLNTTCYLFKLLGRKLSYCFPTLWQYSSWGKFHICSNYLAKTFKVYHDPFDSDVIAAAGNGGFAELGCGGGAVNEYVSLDEEEEFSISPAIPALAI